MHLDLLKTRAPGGLIVPPGLRMQPKGYSGFLFPTVSPKATGYRGLPISRVTENEGRGEQTHTIKEINAIVSIRSSQHIQEAPAGTSGNVQIVVSVLKTHSHTLQEACRGET